MTKIVYTYFNLKALGEAGRMLLAYGGEDFEDNRVSVDEWIALKPKTPFRQLPIIEIDGKMIAQSDAICRYLGHKYGLAGSNFEEDLLIDQSYSFLNDVRGKAAAVFYEKDEEVKNKKHEDNAKNLYPLHLSILDELIKKNNGYLALGRLTWVDFAFAGMIDYVAAMMQIPDMGERYPSFKKLKETVVSLPKVKEFCAGAPPGLANF